MIDALRCSALDGLQSTLRNGEVHCKVESMRPIVKFFLGDWVFNVKLVVVEYSLKGGCSFDDQNHPYYE